MTWSAPPEQTRFPAVSMHREYRLAPCSGAEGSGSTTQRSAEQGSSAPGSCLVLGLPRGSTVWRRRPRAAQGSGHQRQALGCLRSRLPLGRGGSAQLGQRTDRGQVPQKELVAEACRCYPGLCPAGCQALDVIAVAIERLHALPAVRGSVPAAHHTVAGCCGDGMGPRGQRPLRGRGRPPGRAGGMPHLKRGPCPSGRCR